jgi:hypothetical protein
VCSSRLLRARIRAAAGSRGRHAAGKMRAHASPAASANDHVSAASVPQFTRRPRNLTQYLFWPRIRSARGQLLHFHVRTLLRLRLFPAKIQCERENAVGPTRDAESARERCRFAGSRGHFGLRARRLRARDRALLEMHGPASSL